MLYTNGMVVSETESIALRRISFTIFGAASGFLYGVSTMSTEIISGCFGPSYGHFLCGVISWLSNLITFTLADTLDPKGAFYAGLWNVITILAMDALLGGILAFYAISSRSKHPFSLFLILSLAFVILPIVLLFVFHH